MRTAVYPGTFDPITLGHMDIIRRGVKLCDRLVIGVTTNPSKSPMFSVEERMAMVRREIAAVGGDIAVVSFDSLLMKFAEDSGASMIIRGLRAVSDFEYEFQMAGMNRYLLPDVETLFLTPSDQYQFISGTIVREIAILGGDVSKFVFPSVEKWLQQKIAEQGEQGA
jgi:pantetheine-phosphate adenylyltransferase